MSLVSWAMNPRGAPAPISFDTPSWSATHLAYNLRYVRPEALAPDLRDRGLSYRLGVGYLQHGQRIDRHRFADAIAEVFGAASVALTSAIADDPALARLERLQRERQTLPYRDPHAADEFAPRRAQLADETERLEAGLPFTIAALTLARDSYAATEAILRGTSRNAREAREIAVARFRPVIEADVAASLDDRVAAFLAALPPGRIDRTDLRALAVRAGLVTPAAGEPDPFPGERRLGQRELYRRAATALGGVFTSRGTHYFRVPDAA